MMTEDILEALDAEYWDDMDEAWRSSVCTDDLEPSVFVEFLDAWWVYNQEDN
jgi:hypothetical protein